MLCRVVMLSLSLVPCCLNAQEQRLMKGEDTLHYTYTPLPSIDAKASMEMNSGKTPKDNWLRRIVAYFERSNEDRTFEKKIDVTFAGGPSYSKNTSFGIGLLASGLYRTDRTDSVTQPSNVSIFANVSVSGFYAVGITGNTIWSRTCRSLRWKLVCFQIYRRK